MNPSDNYPVTRSPKRELQGPRPTPLKVRKDSHKIKKPPLAPSNQHYHQHHNQQQPPPPVIIYTVSPKVIHTNPSEFMNLVQRLTGAGAASSANPFNFDRGGGVSPAARYATIEKTRTPAEGKKKTVMESGLESFEMMMGDQGVERTGSFPAGILSPGPTTLPPISPNFFSPAFDANMLGNLLHELSPMVNNNSQGTNNKISFFEGSFMPSPTSTNFVISPHFTSTTSPTIDLFNHFFDF